MKERKIGKVISVDSFRVIVQLDDDLKTLYKSGFNDIYEIARINSYLVIPVGSDRIVAIITRVKVQDETEIEKSSGTIILPKAQRYLGATMIGTIESGNDYKQGVYNFPILDNPVWYVTKEDLDKIFDIAGDDEVVDFEKSYYLPIGTSPAFSDYKIKINPDKFFGKHAAILGNTGSGKSCTVASIIQSLFRHNYNGKELQNAHFVIFDTNGEYKRAFIGSEQNTYDRKQQVNPFYINQDGLKVPYWFMNFDDFDYLFRPSELTQAPILKTAIGYAKSKTNITNNNLSKYYERLINSILDSDDLFMKKHHKPNNSWVFNPENEIIQLSNEITNDFKEIKEQLLLLGNETNKINEIKIKQQLEVNFNSYLNQKEKTKETISESIDYPIYFEFSELLTRFIDQAIDSTDGSSQKMREHLSTLKMRMHSYLSDNRISTPLILSQKEDVNSALAKFISFILGDLSSVYEVKANDLFTEYVEQQNGMKDFEQWDINKTSQITIIDMSLIPFEVLETITGLIGRLILEFSSRIEARGSFPIAIILEEAQNYIPEQNRGDRVSISKRIFERIAREGRKFGISLIVSSQRPSELSKTVLSQCNSFVIHRLQNPEDQKYIRQLVSAANEDILQQLPILPQQHAIIMGDAVRTPSQVRINTAIPKPNSDNPQFIENWTKEPQKDFPDYIGIASRWEKGE